MPKNKLATTEDIKALKGDIKKLDIKASATRSDLKRAKSVLWQEILRVEERVEKTEENLKEAIRQSTNDLMTKIDSFAGKTKALEDENTVGTHQTRELRVQVDNHEKRITVLEQAA